MNRDEQLNLVLRAIRARIVGEWDHPALLAFGPLTTDTINDVLTMVEEGLTL